ncbi:hypothetical protein [Burkholderia guangdongensis]|uniref:hypothetical protein n=1 Tax=Burkholderia guangdongensis TaxID=1792500 RepID=UPI0015CB66A5|nr:hypothetical protein [Burkholderia guangdongensis]
MDPRYAPSDTDRSLRIHADPRQWLASIAVLTPTLYGALWLALPHIWRYWYDVLDWGAHRLDPSLAAIVIRYPADSPRVPLLSISLETRLPGPSLIAGTAACCLAAFAATFVRQAHWLPGAYLLRIASAAQLVVCVYFWLAGSAFPYRATLHLRDMFVLNASAIALIPLVMAALYYPLDFTFAQKAAASALVLGYFVAALPFVLLLHALVIHAGSVLWLPFCYFVLGAPLMIGLLVALYTYCASWPGALTERAR